MKSTLTKVYHTLFNPVAKISRLPYILIHLVAYTGLYFLVQLGMYFGMYSSGQIALTASVLVLTLLLSPVYTRRAQDLGWGKRSFIYFMLLPAFLRFSLLLIPLLSLLIPALFPLMLVIIKPIALIFKFLEQIMLIYFVVLAGAPSVGIRESGSVGSSEFSLNNLYGYAIFKK